jgi:preprotein translocase subunit SecA
MINLSLLVNCWQRWWPAGLQKGRTARLTTIREFAGRLVDVPDEALAQQVADLRSQLAINRRSAKNSTKSIDPAIQFQAIAVVLEAARRVLGVTLYDVQLLAGLALARGAIAEMRTGEGKTFCALIPACIHALKGEGVHVMTVNAYLAQRDFEQLAPVYRLLGLTAGLIEANASPAAKRAAYACDITYGPGYEFGFDYLRDQLALMMTPRSALGTKFIAEMQGRPSHKPAMMQRGHAFAVIDEADSVLLDEATTPLILATGGDQPAANTEVYRHAGTLADTLEQDAHFVIKAETRSLHLTPLGQLQLQSHSPDFPRRGLDRPWSIYVEQALRAKYFFHRDEHYVVRDNEIALVDQSTGRIFLDRSWSDGLQQAVQAKEQVKITAENHSAARITRQRYFRRYQQVCGMTGTAQGAEGELLEIYGLDVEVIPPHRPNKRIQLPTRTFSSMLAKEHAILSDIASIHRTGQPVLVGTASIAASERLAGQLGRKQIPFQLLNGKQDAAEAAIIASAGVRSALTIATNMAGRGTDIKLGPGVAELGGLHVIAAEPQRSTRIDRQLIGRAARQGDPGSCRVYASVDDELFIRHAPESRNRLVACGDASGECQIDLSREIASLQSRVERASRLERSQMYRHDDWLESVLKDLAASD